VKLKDNEVITKPKILALPNGPLYLINDTNPKVMTIFRIRWKTLSTTIGIALCRCGASKNKLFCDGSHSVIGFLSNNSDFKKDNHRKDYVGRNIIIHDNRSICSNAAECVENLASVFRLNERPWISPDGGSV
jgi:CDGSH-type Zn-finger protein